MEQAQTQSRRKYFFTDQIDQLIREIYLNHRDAKTRPGIRPLAKKIGMPHWALKKRARELGLARTKELPWNETELAILSRYAWMSDERIRLKLKAAGYSRTVTGIHLKLKRMRFKHDGSFYSAYSLAQALGIDPHAVTRWIKSGHLKANFRGTARGPQQNGDSYLIQEKDVRRFIVEHPTDIDLRKVDQIWFLDLITNGFRSVREQHKALAVLRQRYVGMLDSLSHMRWISIFRRLGERRHGFSRLLRVCPKIFPILQDRAVVIPLTSTSCHFSAAVLGWLSCCLAGRS